MLPWESWNSYDGSPMPKESFSCIQHPALEPWLEHEENWRWHGRFIGKVATDADGEVLAESNSWVSAVCSSKAQLYATRRSEAVRRGAPPAFAALILELEPRTRTARLSFLPFFVRSLFGGNGLLLFLVSSIGLCLFLRCLFMHGLRGSVTHIG